MPLVLLSFLAALVAASTAGERLTVPTPLAAVDRMVDLAEIRPGDKIYDLGCGDGRIVITAAQRHGVEAVGVDIDPEQVARSRGNAERAGVEDLVTIVEGDIYRTDFRDADVVFLYLQPDLLRGLIQQLRQMKAGARCVTFDFGIDEQTSIVARVCLASKAGEILVNGAVLRFWHFTKLGPTGDVMTKRYAGDNFEVYEVWRWYKEAVAAATDPAIPERWWAHGQFDDGAPIAKPQRVLYRERADLQAAFPDPFEGGYQAWWKAEGPGRRG
jgi:SAM-dependent methyltransferase